MEMWIPLLSEYGFPIMITLYLLHRIEKKLDLLNDSMKRLTIQLERTYVTDESRTQLKYEA